MSNRISSKVRRKCRDRSATSARLWQLKTKSDSAAGCRAPAGDRVRQLAHHSGSHGHRAPQAANATDRTGTRSRHGQGTRHASGARHHQQEAEGGDHGERDRGDDYPCHVLRDQLLERGCDTDGGNCASGDSACRGDRPGNACCCATGDPGGQQRRRSVHWRHARVGKWDLSSLRQHRI